MEPFQTTSDRADLVWEENLQRCKSESLGRTERCSGREFESFFFWTLVGYRWGNQGVVNSRKSG